MSTSPPAPAAGSDDGTANELERLADLYTRGALTSEEFAAAKTKILGTTSAPAEPEPEPDTDAGSFPAVEANVAAARYLAELAAQDDASVTTFSSD